VKKILLILLFFFLHFLVNAQVYVNGYYRKNGTYVEPHYRSSPDRSPTNNYSYPGNTNPYTGKVATGNPETYLKRYKGRVSGSTSSTYGGSENLLGLKISERNVRKGYYIDDRGFLRKMHKKDKKTGLGLFLISVPLVFGTILFFQLKK
jgi:hypothetical protein